MSSEDNIKKARAGVSAQQALRDTVNRLQTMGAVVHVQEKPTYGYPGYDPDQFFAHMGITFADGEEAILYTTASLSSDRVRAHQWNAFNIKKIDPHTTHAYLILPDSQKINERSNEPIVEIRSKRIVSALDDILTTQELYELGTKKLAAISRKGANNDLQGKSFEEVIKDILKSESNVARFKGDTSRVGFWYDIFAEIMKVCDVRPDHLVRISATTAIKPNARGGSPKTDVAAWVYFDNETMRTLTFSVKNTSQKSVSVHEYPADTFADVLDSVNDSLRAALRVFQRAGSMRNMTQQERETLTRELKPYLFQLDRWVFGGHGDPALTPVQCADYLIVHDKNSHRVAVHRTEEYCRLLERNNKGTAGFGSVFGWTYPSKKRGKSIQLKGKIVF